MKNVIAFILTSFFIAATNAQIRIIENKEKKVNISTYDSLTNFKKNPSEYIGQRLYLKPRSESLRKYGFDKFYPRKENKIWKTYSYFTHDSIAGKTFDVLGVVKIDEKATYSETCLILKEPKTNDTIYFEFDPIYEHSFPFIVEGYHKKLLSKFKGVKYVSRYKNLNDYDSGKQAIDINGELVNNSVGSVWTIDDFIVEDKYYNLEALLVNSSGQKVLHSINAFENNHNYWFVPLSLCNKIKNKYGSNLYQTALDGSVKVGMTKELCEFAWGKPDDVNKTTGGSTREQWVYKSGSYLYFTNGKLTSIQN